MPDDLSSDHEEDHLDDLRVGFRRLRGSEYGDPVTQAELLKQLSPIHKLERIVTPVLVLHGKNDTNVPVVEAEQIVETLKKRRVTVEYVLFPDEGHGWRKTENRIKATIAVTSWFDKYLRL